ncbi:MAG: pyruvate kinase [Anaerolineales bacterium]|nr:pyruvate kinase [Anaerolineales bacterium]
MAHQILPSKKTKIVCTIGPASQSQEVLTKLIQKGMNIARINFAHGDFDSHRQTIANVRAAAAMAGERVAIFGDLPGPKMRIGRLEEEPIELESGQPFILQTEEILGNHKRVSMDFAGLPQAVKMGDRIYMNDGYIQLRVEQVVNDAVHCTVRMGGELRSHKGVNFPGIDLGIDVFTDHDHKMLAFAAEQKLDAVSQSFVSTAADIEAVRTAAAELDYDPLIIAKIERAGALPNLEAIVAAADGIMVARGDLGVEIPIEEIPFTQKQIILAANMAGKPVITATQMLESMTTNRRPTRAEVTDVANAILDGTDCVMLSGETAVGQFPIDTVSTMSRIAAAIETSVDSEDLGILDLLRLQRAANEISIDDLISYSVFRTAERLRPQIVIVPSRSGATARRITRFRLPQWVLAPSMRVTSCQRLQFSYGVLPIFVPAEELDWDRFSRQLPAHFGLHTGLAMLVEGAGTLDFNDTKRIDIIQLNPKGKDE